MSENFLQPFLAGLFLLLAIAIAGWQQRARTCARHNHHLGGVAWALVAVCLTLAASLIFAQLMH
jgi:hypothetical protein